MKVTGGSNEADDEEEEEDEDRHVEDVGSCSAKDSKDDEHNKDYCEEDDEYDEGYHAEVDEDDDGDKDN
jgi:hypothetical protein